MDAPVSLNSCADANAAEANSELQLIMDAVTAGICGLDAERKATFCNDPFLEMTGYSRKEVVGRNMHELLHHSLPDGTKLPMDQCELLRETDCHQAKHFVGGALWRKDGTCFAAECWVRPLQELSGPTRYVVTVNESANMQSRS